MTWYVNLPPYIHHISSSLSHSSHSCHLSHSSYHVLCKDDSTNQHHSKAYCMGPKYFQIPLLFKNAGVVNGMLQHIHPQSFLLYSIVLLYILYCSQSYQLNPLLSTCFSSFLIKSWDLAWGSQLNCMCSPCE